MNLEVSRFAAGAFRVLAADGLAEDCVAEDRVAADRERADPVAFVTFVDVLRDVFFTAGRRAGDVLFFAAVFRVLVVPRAVLFFVVFFAKPTSSTPSCTAGAR